MKSSSGEYLNSVDSSDQNILPWTKVFQNRESNFTATEVNHDTWGAYLSHCPMQGPQALARTIPPTSFRILD